MPKTAAKTKEQLENTKVNPKSKVKGSRVISVTLILQDVEFDPKVLYEALDAKYGTVSTDKDTIGRGSYTFRIAA